MALPRLKLQAPAKFELAPSPLIDGKPWTEGLDYFYCWLCQNFGEDEIFPDFELAQKLNVHRVIADEWLVELGRQGYIEHHIRRMSQVADCPAAYGFSRLAPSINIKVALNASSLVGYDPWTDRSLDEEIADAVQADSYIDKFFDLFNDEFYIFNRVQRMRSNRKRFQALSLTEHPRYADPATKRRFENSPPPQEWRQAIEAAANG